MSRRLGLHPMAKTPIGKSIMALCRAYRALDSLNAARKRAELSCIGCGCADGYACVGGCSWSEPGLCSRCAPDAEKLLRPTDRVNELVKSAAVNARIVGRTSFRVPSLAIVAWMGDFADTHRERRLEGYRLRPMTSVRLGRTAWSFSLVYSMPRPNPDLVGRFVYSFRLGTGVSRKRAKR